MIQDAISGLFWIAATCYVARSSYSISRNAFPDDSATQVILHLSVMAIAVCVLNLTFLGSLGLLTGVSSILGVVGLSLIMGRCRLQPSAANKPNNKTPRASLLWLTVAIILGGHTICSGLMRLPTDYDCLMYHLPLINQWLQSGSLAATRIGRWSDSANSELLALWFTATFSGDFLVGLNNVPVMIVWATALLELSRLLGLMGWLRHGAAIACLAVYTSVHETDDASNDLMVAALFVAGLAYSLRYIRSAAVSDLALTGIAIGLLAGTKFFAIGYALLLVVAFAILSFQTGGLKNSVFATCSVIVIAIPFGSYWYIRNICITGYPLFPQGSSVLHERIVHPDILRTTLAFNGDPTIVELVLRATWSLCGPIHYLGLLATPALIVGLVVVAIRGCRKHSVDQYIIYTLLSVFVGTLAITLLTPMLVEDQPDTLNHLRWGYTPVRYALAFLCIMTLSMAVLLQRLLCFLPPWAFRVLSTGFALLALAQFFYRFWSRSEVNTINSMLVGGVCTLVVFVLYWCLQRDSWQRPVAIMAIAGATAVSIGLLSRQWHDGYAEHFSEYYSAPVFTTVNHRAGCRILVLDDQPYAYFGSRRQNYVLQPMAYHGLKSVKEVMEKNDLSFVVTRKGKSSLSRYRPAWSDLKSDDEFELVGEGPALRLFRLRAAAE
eukprot:TRINITY_DN800_c0_g1_i1.p2 TRINITY_DN800_c0_g1~~TRINITY_DN800_c0_g1_i1.p2  ORF type:complete len:664 (+),score=32.92 TRINITY_DN800_c0_g1_i1:7617-9608(+)